MGDRKTVFKDDRFFHKINFPPKKLKEKERKKKRGRRNILSQKEEQGGLELGRNSGLPKPLFVGFKS